MASVSLSQITSSVRRGLLIDDSLARFEFTPSIGIAAARMDKLGIDIRSFREPLKRVVQQVMAPSFRKNFESGGRPSAWAPLSDVTLEIQSRMGISRAGGPLVRTGLLMRTVQQLNIWTITQESATIRSLPDKVVYGGIHQAGYGGGSGGTKSMSGMLSIHGGDAKAAMHALDDALIDAMNSGSTVSSRQAAPIPQRQFIMVQDDDYDEIEKVFSTWMRERVAAVGMLAVG